MTWLSRLLWALVVVFLILAFCNCSLPNWRVFQKTVDSRDGQKPVVQVQGERRAAAYIVARTTPPVPDPAVAVVDVQSVAQGLSASLGQPDVPVTLEDKDQVIAALRAGNMAKDKQLDKWKEFARKYAGKPLEDTGINLAGPAGILGLVGIMAACVACPAIGYALLRVIPLLWGFFRATTSAIGEFTRERPDAGSELATKLRGKMDQAHKSLVKIRASKVRIPESVSHAPFPVTS